MRKAAPSPVRLELTREEWDFHAPPRGFLPEDEVLACHTYETARLDGRWASEFRTWRMESKHQSFDAFLRTRDEWLGANRTPPHEFYMYWPEWTQKPYLKVPERIRRER